MFVFLHRGKNTLKELISTMNKIHKGQGNDKAYDRLIGFENLFWNLYVSGEYYANIVSLQVRHH